MAFSAYLADKVLSWAKGTTFPVALTNVYVSLHSGDPGTSGTSNDVTATIQGSATRVGIPSANFSAVSSSAGGGFEITNSNVVQFTTNAVNGALTTVTHFGLWDASTSGNFLASGSLSSSVDVATGDTVQFNAGALAIRVV